MRNDLHIIERGKQVSPEELIQFEKDNNIIMPEGLKTLFLKYNPGYFKETYLSKNEITTAINTFLPFDNDLRLSFQTFYFHLKELLENRYLSFAFEGGGESFVTSLNSDDYGSVYFLRLDVTLDHPHALTYVCKDIEEFIDGLTDESVWT